MCLVLVFGHASHLCLGLLSYELVCLSCWFWFRFSGESGQPGQPAQLSWCSHWLVCSTHGNGTSASSQQKSQKCSPCNINAWIPWHSLCSVPSIPHECLQPQSFLRLQVFLTNLQDMLMYPFHFPWEIPHLGKIRFILIATSAKIVNLSGCIKDSFLGPGSSSLRRSSSTWTSCLQEELCITSASIDQWPWRVQQFLDHLWSEQILGQVWTHPSHILKANQWRFKVQTRPRMTTRVSSWKVHIFTWMHSTTNPGLGR